MDLWIRSQDKEKLVLTKGFETQHTNYDGGCQIFAVWENNYQMVGKYKNKKRALEVLDEIQNILFYKKMSEDDFQIFAKIIIEKYDEKTKNKIYMSTAVYEMPID